LAVILGNCASNPSKSIRDEALQLDTVADYIAKARTLAPAESAPRLLHATSFLIEQGRTDWAKEILQSLNPAQLKDAQFARYLLYQAKIANKNGEPYFAQRYLFNDKLEALLPSLGNEDAQQLREARATLLCDLAEYVACVRERVALAPLLSDEASVQLNNDLLWDALMEVPFDELTDLARAEKDRTLEGWYALAETAKNQNTSLAQQLQNIDNWLTMWPDHPAAKALPADLQLIRQLVDQQPRQIAVLLPFSGRLAQAADAIRDGFMAAYFEARQQVGQIPQVRFYDSSAEPATELYQRALDDGAEMIVGPLDKDAVNSLLSRDSFPVPTLVLNSLDKPAANADVNAISNLYSFSLSIESEAEDVAERAWKDGKRRAMVLAPANAWGDRGVAAFSAKWQELGGEIATDKRYSVAANFSTQISAALDVDQSKTRARNLRQLIGQPIEFEPRRRKDIDFIFLLANMADAQQLKPLFAFHYAGDIPVYATSQIYDGSSQTNLRDLNRIRFTTLPWFLDDKLDEKRAITAYSKVRPGFQGLYALGVDAYRIYPRLKQLEKFHQARFHGATGKLAVSDDHEILRQQEWAEIKSGTLIPLTSSTESPSDSDSSDDNN